MLYPLSYEGWSPARYRSHRRSCRTTAHPTRSSGCHGRSATLTGHDRAPCDHVPRRLPLGCRHRQLPDRGGSPRRWSRRQRVGRVLPHGGQGGQRPQRRRGLRPLPPARRRRRHDGRPRSAVLPLLDLVVEGHPRRPRRREPRGPRLLPPLGRAPARQRHHPVPDAVPLGPPPGTRGDRRVPQPRHRQLVRRLRRAHGARTRRPGPDVVDVQRALVLRLPRPRRRTPRARPDGPPRSRHRRPPSTARPRARAPGHAGRTQRPRSSAS